MKPFLRGLLALWAIALPAAAAEPLRVGVPSQGFVFSPLLIGIEQGIFARHGVTVERQLFSGAAKLTQALTVGATDIVLSGATDAAYSIKGAPETMICAIAIKALNLGINVGNDIHAVADLKGAKIGVTQTGTVTYWLAKELARTQGWGENGITPIPVGGLTSSQMAALTSGQAQAVIADSSIGLQLVASGRGRLLMTADTYVPNFLTIAMFGQNDVLKQRPDEIKRFIAAWLDTIALLLNDKPTAVRIAAAGTELSEAVITRSYDLQKPQWSRDGRIDPAQLSQLAKALLDIQLVDELPDLTKVTTNQFLPTAASN